MSTQFEGRVLPRYLSPECAAFGCGFSHWEQAIRYAGSLLLNNGHIKGAYIRRMTDAIHAFGSYIVLAKGVALAHAKPEGDVLSSAMSTVLIPDGVSFSHDSGPVHLLMAVATDEPLRHEALFRELAAFLSDGEAVAAAQRASGFEELMRCICGCKL